MSTLLTIAPAGLGTSPGTLNFVCYIGLAPASSVYSSKNIQLISQTQNNIRYVYQLYPAPAPAPPSKKKKKKKNERKRKADISMLKKKKKKKKNNNNNKINKYCPCFYFLSKCLNLFFLFNDCISIVSDFNSFPRDSSSVFTLMTLN